MRGADMHVLDRLKALLRYRWAAGGVLLATLVATFIHAYSQTPMYRAGARILIELEDEHSLAVEGVGGAPNSSEYVVDPEPYFQTQYRILTGRDLARRAVARLDRQTLPELDGTLPPSRGIWRLVESMRLQVGRKLRSLRGVPEPLAPTNAPLPVETAADLVAARLQVAPVKSSRLVDVYFLSSNPTTASSVVNAVVDAYVAQNLTFRRQSMNKSMEWLAEEVARQHRIMETSERAMADYRATQKTTALGDSSNVVTARLAQLNDAATRARTTRAQKESLLKQVETLGSAAADAIPSVASNAYVQSIKVRVADLQRQRALLSERYGDRHPEMVSLAASLEDATHQLNTEVAKAVDSIRHEYESAVLEERTMAQALADQQSVAMDLERKNVSYTLLEREAASNRTLYESLLQREKELQVLANSRGNNVRVVEHARTPTMAATPDIRRMLMMGLMLGLVAAVGLVIGLDYLDDTIKTQEDITRKLGLPCLGLLPAVKDSADGGLLTQTATGQFGESIRSLRTSVAFSHAEQGAGVLLVTSAQPLEGKTTTACNLAIALAVGGAKVLLIDADMRRPNVHETIGLPAGPGLSDVLMDRVALAGAVVRLDSPSLWVLQAGSPPPNPSELLGSSTMSRLMTQLRTGPFDWVVIDTPPVLAVTDAPVVGKYATGVVFVVGANMTRRRAAERAIESMAVGGPRILGAVLNRGEQSSDAYYAYEQYHVNPATAGGQRT